MSLPRALYYGGSFDPPHQGHHAWLQAAIAQIQPNHTLVVPTGNPSSYKSRPLSAAAHRLALCELAFADLPGVRISAIEAHSTVANYTIQTLAQLQADYAQTVNWHLLLGSDQVAQLHTWRAWQDLVQQVTIVWAPRPLSDAKAERQLHDNLAHCPHWLALEGLHWPLSSTALRQVLAQENRQPSAKTLLATGLDPQVLRYIDEHSLYL